MKKYVSSYPHLVDEWHPTKNGSARPDDFTHGSRKIVWWLCSKGHEYERTIHKRSRTLKGCPYCSGRRVGDDNNLLVLFPDVAAEWDIKKNKPDKPEHFTHGSTKQAWWTCKNYHSYRVSINQRTSGRGCPFCAGKRVSSQNSLIILYPKISKEWHPTKNGSARPDDFTHGSRKTVWWLCSKGHEYKAAIKGRTSGRGCPQCSHHTSSPEIRIFTELKSIFKNVKNRYRLDGVEADIFIPDIRVAIEYDGSYFHKNKIDLDKKKNDFFTLKSIKLIRVRHHPLRPISKYDVIVKKDELTKNDLNELMKSLRPVVTKQLKGSIEKYIKRKSFLNENGFREYISYFPSPFPEKTLDVLFPMVAKEWDIEKNIPLMPSNFSPGSHQVVWWLCSKGHEYKAAIKGRASGRGCPYCSGNKVGSDNNLLALFPNIAAEWDYEKNKPDKPEHFTHGSKRKVWWICSADHSYFSRINNRTSFRKAGCPKCAILRRKKTARQKSGNS